MAKVDTIKPESTPPLKKHPIGTSEIVLLMTAAVNFFSNSFNTPVSFCSLLR
jgi:hypothetical protein